VGVASIDVVPVGPLQANCYLVWERKDAALVVDPGDEADRIAARVRELGLTPRLIVTTHGHFDHTGAVEPLKALWGAPYRVHAAEAPVLAWIPAGTRLWGLTVPPPPKPDGSLSHGDALDVEGLEVRVIHTPGHTPGSVCLHVPAMETVLTGDTLFLGSIGRSDFPGGDHEQLLGSIRERLLTLPPNTRVLPGHGPASTVGFEAENNPWLV
jgi:hydroxyacylglutathione hydrolase